MTNPNVEIRADTIDIEELSGLRCHWRSLQHTENRRIWNLLENVPDYLPILRTKNFSAIYAMRENQRKYPQNRQINNLSLRTI